MSADDGYLIRQKPNGKWIAQYINMSVNAPPIDDKRPMFETQEDAIAFYRDGASNTEYGFVADIPHHDPEEGFLTELANLIKKYERQEKSHTDVTVLALYLEAQLSILDNVIISRDVWHGETPVTR